MRLKNFLTDDTTFEEVLNGVVILEHLQRPLNEIAISDDAFMALKDFGSKYGIRIEKSRNIFDYLKSSGKGLSRLVKLTAMYADTDLKDSKTRKSIASNIKKEVKKVNKQDIINFFLILDKNTTHITSILRHVLEGLTGIHVGSYGEWKSDRDYVLEAMEKVKKVYSECFLILLV